MPQFRGVTSVTGATLERNNHQESRILAQLQPEDAFAEQALHGEHHQRKATVQCMDDIRLLRSLRADYQSNIRLAPADKDTIDKVVYLPGVFLFCGF